MLMKMYRLKCLTNLHMGGNGIGYSIVDLEVEKDPVTQEPVMNSTGVKGALRDWFSHQKDVTEDDTNFNFGKPGQETTQGACKFFSGDLLARPVPVTDGTASYALGTTMDLLKNFFDKAFYMQATGAAFPAPELPNLANRLLVGSSALRRVNDISTETAVQESNEAFMDFCRKVFETDNWVVMNFDQLHDHSLSVQAHNVLENGKSDNLWYQEYVPHESVFGLLIGYPDGATCENNKLMKALHGSPVVQFGAGASTGDGFVKITEMEF